MEENLNFHVADNTLVDIDIDQLNDVLRTSGHTKVDKDDDSDEINVEYCDEDDEIKEEEEEEGNSN